ncbi:hypothetical protein C1H46_003934 [Malus baccata]|uniref:Uncharacterized protein n=1 Tax=Malus baccata TaxID=106549 RepID=A0A540NHJ8_MALBA|nr:hypothetical protein C1H46_003934 [Malus baccata]
MGSKNRKESSSTKRGPSKFEIVEKAQKRARRVCHFIYLSFNIVYYGHDYLYIHTT